MTLVNKYTVNKTAIETLLGYLELKNMKKEESSCKKNE